MASQGSRIVLLQVFKTIRAAQIAAKSVWRCNSAYNAVAVESRLVEMVLSGKDAMFTVSKR